MVHKYLNESGIYRQFKPRPHCVSTVLVSDNETFKTRFQMRSITPNYKVSFCKNYQATFKKIETYERLIPNLSQLISGILAPKKCHVSIRWKLYLCLLLLFWFWHASWLYTTDMRFALICKKII